MRKRLKYLALLLSIMAMSCIKENTEECLPALNLRFRFTLHEGADKKNLFGENIGQVKVFVFDKNNTLQHIKIGKGADLTNDYLMQIDLEPGRYSIIVWASDNENFSRTHNNLHVLDVTQNPPRYKDLEIGQSKIKDLQTLLDTKDETEYPDWTTPVIKNFDDLYYGALGKRSSDGKSQYTVIPIEIGTEVVEHEIELIRNTNIVRITVEGLEHLDTDGGAIAPGELIGAWMTGLNTQYNFYNSLVSYPKSTFYYPQYTLPQANTAQIDIKTERLEWDIASKMLTKLHIILASGKVLYSGDLLSLLKEAKDTQGNLIYKNQEDLDRIYTHPIRFVIESDYLSESLQVKVYIHNWELVSLITDL